MHSRKFERLIEGASEVLTTLRQAREPYRINEQSDDRDVVKLLSVNFYGNTIVWEQARQQRACHDQNEQISHVLIDQLQVDVDIK